MKTKNIFQNRQTKPTVIFEGSDKNINVKRSCPLQEHQDTPEHSSEQNVSSDFEDNYNTSAQKEGFIYSGTKLIVLLHQFEM